MYIGVYNEDQYISQSLKQSRHLQFPEGIVLEPPLYRKSLSVKNMTDRPITYKVVLTNPDNYCLVINNTTCRLAVDETLNMVIQMKLYDSISRFNYNRNRIYLLTRDENSDEKEVSQISIIVDEVGMLELPKPTKSYVRRYIKIHKHNERMLEEQERAYLINYISKLGELHTISGTDSFVMCRFYHQVEIDPHIIQHNDNVYSICYQSTFTGNFHKICSDIPTLLAPETDQLQKIHSKSCLESTSHGEQPVLFPTVSLPIDAQIRGFFVCPERNALVWHTETTLTLYDLMNQKERKYAHESGFSVRTLPNYICVVLERNMSYFYTSISKRYNIDFKDIRPNLMCLSDKILFLTERQQSKHKKSFSLWPFNYNTTSSPENSPKKDITKAHRHIYLYEMFNTRKNSLSPDNKITLTCSPIDILQANRNTLILFAHPEIILYDVTSMEMVLKLEKSVSILKPLIHYHSVNRLNLVSVDNSGGVSIFNIDRLGGTYGAEIVDLVHSCIESVSEGQDGALYCFDGQQITHFDLRHRKAINKKPVLSPKQQLYRLSLSLDCLVVYKHTELGCYLQTRYIPDLLGYCN